MMVHSQRLPRFWPRIVNLGWGADIYLSRRMILVVKWGGWNAPMVYLSRNGTPCAMFHIGWFWFAWVPSYYCDDQSRREALLRKKEASG
jgi:hypothetical protein